MAEFDGTSKSRRPDAVSLDYLTSHSMGPVDQQDPSEGVFTYAWRVRLIDNFVALARETDGAWEEDTILFSITDGLGAALALDLGFTQSADPVVAVERATGFGGISEIWIYYYNPLLAAFEFGNFGEGRNPRVVIDQPHNSLEADIQVFYISSVVGLVHRQQRDRYQIEYFIAAADENMFLEEALVRTDRRIELVLAVRDVEAGQYDLQSVVSLLYPIAVETEALNVSNSVSDLVLRVVIFAQDAEVESLGVSHVAIVDLHELLILYDVVEEVGVSHSIELELRTLLIQYSLETEEISAVNSIAALVFTQVITDFTPEEEMSITHSLSSIAFGPP